MHRELPYLPPRTLLLIEEIHATVIIAVSEDLLLDFRSALQIPVDVLLHLPLIRFFKHLQELGGTFCTGSGSSLDALIAFWSDIRLFLPLQILIPVPTLARGPGLIRLPIAFPS